MIARLEVLKLNYLPWQSWQSRYVAGIKVADATAKVGAASGDKADKAVNGLWWRAKEGKRSCRREEE